MPVLLYDLRKTRRELIPLCTHKPWQKNRYRIGWSWWFSKTNIVRFPSSL